MITRPDAIVFAGTGHRPNKVFGLYEPEDWKPAVHYVRDYLLSWWITYGIPMDVISGLAIFWDQVLLEGALLAKEAGADIRLIGAIPVPGQERSWSQASQSHYWRLVSRLDAGKEPLFSPKDYRPMNRRNAWMVDRVKEAPRGGYILAYHDGIPYDVGGGGTAHCIDYAEATVGPMRIINLYEPVRIIMRAVYESKAS